MDETPKRRRAPRCAWLAYAAALLLAPTIGFASSSPPRLTSIALEPSGGAVSLIPGDSQALRATATFSDKSTQDYTAAVVFTSSDPSVVAIVGPALAQAIASGDAEVTAVDPASGKKSRTSVKFKVAKLSAIDLLPATKVVRVGGTLRLQALGTYDNGRSGIDLTQLVAFTSDKAKIATVSNDAASKGVVTGVALGTVKIYARDPASGVKSSNDASRVTVVGGLASLQVTPASRTLRIGASGRFKATGTFGGGLTADVSADVAWTISDPSIATIDASGKATGVAVGEATVSASDAQSGITSTATGGDGGVLVVGDLLGLVVAPAKTVLPIGGTLQMTALGAFDGSPDSVKLSSGLRWKSSNASAFSLDTAKGLGTCAAAGTSTVSVTDIATLLSSTASGGDATVVCASGQPSIRVSPAKNLLAVGKTRKMQAFRVFPDGSEGDATAAVTWSSSNPNAVTIVASGANAGLATAVAPGVATIVASDPVTGQSSDGPGGTSSKLSVAGEPKLVLIFPRPDASGHLAVALGVPFQLKARVDFAGGATQGINNLVDWEPSDPSVLHISDGTDGDPAGWATPLKRGSITVGITYPKASGPPPQFPPSAPLHDVITLDVK